MCRIAAYFGPPTRLASILSEPSHGLEDQSRNAREMADSTVAGDGWGVGWFAGGGPEAPGLIKSILPLWSDENAKTGAHAIASASIVGHVRFASPGSEVCLTNTPLYPLGEFLWTVNGGITPWPGPLSKAIRDRLDPEDEAAVRGSTDAEMLGALWRTCLRRSLPRDAAPALREALALARDLARDHGGHVKMNVIVGHASGFVAARYADGEGPNSLYVLADQDRWPGAALVASEPLDDGPGWRPVAPSTLVLADRLGLRTEPLALRDPRPTPRRQIA